MKIGANSFVWTESFGIENFDVLEKISGAGLDGIELGILEPMTFPARQVRVEIERLGLGCTICCVLPANASLISSDSSCRRRAREHISACLEVTAEVGGEILCGPLYAPVGLFTGKRRTSDEWHYATDAWRELAPLAEQLKVDVAIEPLNRFESYFLNTMDDAAMFCDDVNHHRIGILFDTFHANIEEQDIGDALRRAQSHLKHVHSCESYRGIPGTGTVHWEKFFNAIGEIGYDRWLVIESFGFSLGTLSAAASIWRDLAPSPEAIPFEGARFLRDHLH